MCEWDGETEELEDIVEGAEGQGLGRDSIARREAGRVFQR
jgi:hypothetical protein